MADGFSTIIRRRQRLRRLGLLSLIASLVIFNLAVLLYILPSDINRVLLQYGYTLRGFWNFLGDLAEDGAVFLILTSMFFLDFVIATIIVLYLASGTRPNIRAYCHECGYKLRGNVSNVCPECGRPLPPICFPPIQHPREMTVPPEKRWKT